MQTNTKIQIKKDAGNEDLFSGYDATKTESRGTIEVVGSGNLDAAIKEWERIDQNLFHGFETYNCSVDLTPFEITQFSKSYVISERENSFIRAGLYLTALIQRSYDQGSNYFVIDRDSDSISNLGSGLNAEKSNPLHLHVLNGVGHYFCRSSKNVTAIVDGGCFGHCGFRSLNFNLTIDDTNFRYFADSSKNMNLRLRGDFNRISGKYLSNINAVIEGNLNSSLPYRSKFGEWRLEGDFNGSVFFGNNSEGNNLYVTDEVFNKHVRGKRLDTLWEYYAYSYTEGRFNNRIHNMKTNEEVTIPWKFVRL